MRFVRRNYREEDTPSHLRDVLNIKDFDKILLGDISKINGIIYRGDNNTPKTREAFTVYYLNKCAYCENDEYEPQIEHYRPCGKSRQEDDHSGYPWLCYEWSNMLPSCHDCNRRGAKGTRFPILGNRVTQYPRIANGSPDTTAFKLDHPLMIAEHPMLLHPEIDNPKHFFKFDSEGKIFGTDALGRGEKTKDICRLFRPNLCRARQRIVDDVLNRIRNDLIKYLQGYLDEDGLSAALEQVFTELQEKATNPIESFTLFRWYFFEHFPILFAECFSQKFPLLGDYQQSVLSLYFNFRQRNP